MVFNLCWSFVSFFISYRIQWMNSFAWNFFPAKHIMFHSEVKFILKRKFLYLYLKTFLCLASVLWHNIYITWIPRKKVYQRNKLVFCLKLINRSRNQRAAASYILTKYFVRYAKKLKPDVQKIYNKIQSWKLWIRFSSFETIILL